MVTGQSVEQAIPAKKGNSSGLVEEQSVPTLSNVPAAWSALLSAGQLLASPATSSIYQTGTLVATHTSSSTAIDSYKSQLLSSQLG